MENNFLDISYLKTGNLRQQEAYSVLMNSRVFSILSDYDPVLAGTIPIGIDVAGSDLDIVCKVINAEEFCRLITGEFGSYPNFDIYRKTENIIVCNFYVNGMMIEIFASPVESISTNAYRHMIIEHRILNLLGEDFKQRIIKLKMQGLKTEPAFAALLRLEGDPYKALLKQEDWSDEEIRVFHNKK